MIFRFSPIGERGGNAVKKTFLLALAAVLLSFMFMVSVYAQQATDTVILSLIGTYDGKWTHQHFSGLAELKIARIKNGYLEGAIYYSGRGGTTNYWWKFTDGYLNGMTLTFTAGNGGTFTFTITSNNETLELVGKSAGLAVNADFEFRKNKNRK